jgi:hypothetical protein
MGRLTSLALVALAAGSAQAAPKKKVQIESKPPRASVFIGTTDGEPICKTPCPVEVDGDTTLIVALDGHRPKIDQLVIGRREKAPYKRSYVLEAMIGTLKVEGPAGAVVFVDNAEKGKIPFSEDVSAGKRNVVVKLDGKEIHSSTVEIPEDDEFKVVVTNKPKAVASTTTTTTDPDTDPDPGPKIRKPAGPTDMRVGKLFALSAATSVGFRKFTYKNVPPDTMRDDRGEETEGGQVLAGGLLEIWPGALAGVRPLRGFSLAARVQFGVNSQTVIENMTNAALGARTFWGSIEVSARQKWVFGDMLGAEVSAGFVRDQFQFTGDDTSILKVPDVLYQSVRIGARVSAMLGSLEPYAGIETRVVMSGGKLEARFPGGADANGFRAGAGVAFTIGKIAGGNVSGYLEGTLTRYTWTFVDDGMLDTNGATDQIAQVALSVGYSY